MKKMQLFLFLVFTLYPLSSLAQEFKPLSSPADLGLPTWTPIYPGTSTLKKLSRNDFGKSTVAYDFITTDNCLKVGKFYTEKFKELGFNTVFNKIKEKPNCEVQMLAMDEAGSRTLNVVGVEEKVGSRFSITVVSE